MPHSVPITKLLAFEALKSTQIHLQQMCSKPYLFPQKFHVLLGFLSLQLLLLYQFGAERPPILICILYFISRTFLIVIFVRSGVR
jgi:hypothetical protein